MYIKRFEDITKEDVKTAGGKGANLGEMTRAGIQVPPGGVLTVPAYEQFMKQNQIAVTGEPAAIRRAILDGELPEDVKAEVTAFYRSMGGNVRIAVRSSATAEDLADASFAGQQETYLNIRGEERLLDSIKACYASLWGDRAVSYRREKNYDGQHVALAVVLQRMVESETAGVLFTQNLMLINASYGLGESVVSGAVSPDELTCRRDGKIIRQVVGSKETMVVSGEKETVTVPVKPEDRSRLCITPGQVKELVKAGLSYKTADMNYDLLALADRIMKNPAAKTWREDRERFLQVPRPLLTADRGKEMSRAEEEACYKALLGKMTAGMSEKQSGRHLQLVESYRFYHAYREETQSLWETAFYACRRALERTAELFGVAALDLQYLFWAELRTAMERGSLSAEELDKIAKRKSLRPAAEEYWKRQQWEALKGEGDTLKGVSGSAGEASGEVCVITAPAEFGKLKKGDILVCRYTDPEWTPLFTLAAAVVSDTGGTLSHAAIVAREYNIPAVMAVGCATTTLKDGDRVFVNGTVGEVRCL